MRTTGATLVHPYDDYAVIAGQGTAALELLEDVLDLDDFLGHDGGWLEALADLVEQRRGGAALEEAEGAPP